MISKEHEVLTDLMENAGWNSQKVCIRCSKSKSLVSFRCHKVVKVTLHPDLINILENFIIHIISKDEKELIEETDKDMISTIKRLINREQYFKKDKKSKI